MLRGKCEKCKTIFWLEIHHILPKAIFGNTDKIAYLCPNCHTDYHQKLGNKNLKNPDPEFHYAEIKWI